MSIGTTPQAAAVQHRHDLPPGMPSRIRRLPVDGRGYPVPWFVAWVDGVPDFRVVAVERVLEAVKKDVCWVCGESNHPKRRAFLIGPMCAINRISAEPPGHPECMAWSARACPFLVRPKAKRREAGLPPEHEAPAGIMIARNPGVMLLWVTDRYALMRDDGGLLFRIVGSPIRLDWIAEGRQATRAEIMDSISTGMPILQGLADEQGPEAQAALAKAYAEAMLLVPP